MIKFNLFSPLEQFEIVPLIPIVLGKIDLSISNALLFVGAIFFGFVVLMFSMRRGRKVYDISYRNKTSIAHHLVEVVHLQLIKLVTENIKHKNGIHYLPIVATIFILIFLFNAIGLVPYSFTFTSHLSVTMTFSLIVFIGINIICVKLHGLEIFSLFLPSGTSFMLALLLIPIEIISYVFKPVSLGIRLFANMMAGHALLKVVAGFAFSLMNANSFVLFLLHFIPLFLLIPLIALESAVALIQAYVFSILICICLNDALNLH